MKLNIPLSTCVHIKCKINSPVVYLKFYLDVFYCFSLITESFYVKEERAFRDSKKRDLLFPKKENGFVTSKEGEWRDRNKQPTHSGIGKQRM